MIVVVPKSKRRNKMDKFSGFSSFRLPIESKQTMRKLVNLKSNKQLAVALLLLLSLYFQFLPQTAAFFIDEHHSPQMHSWSYGQQDEWRLGHKQCDHKAQSPIDIQRRNVIQSNQLKLHFYNYNQPTKFKIQNAHHTIKLNPVESDSYAGQSRQAGNAANGLVIDGDQLLRLQPMDKHQSQPNRSNNNNRQQVRGDKPQAEIAIGDGPRTGSGQQPPNSADRIQSTDSSHSSSGGGRLVPPEDDYSNSGLVISEQLPYNGAPTIKLDWLDDGNNEYQLKDIHFHWGERRDNGSEHAIDGRRAAMEMHLVHIKHGLDKSKIEITSDSVAVIAILIESYRKSNADFNPIVNALTRINMTDEAQEIEYKSINDLLPNVLNSFYTYSGSLTTPPCYQVVNWVVMSDRLYLNAKQIEMFRNLYAPSVGETHLQSPTASAVAPDSSAEEPTNGEPVEPALIMPNIRQIQPLNNRTILASFQPLAEWEKGQKVGSPAFFSGASTCTTGAYYHLLLTACCLVMPLALINNNNKLRSS